MSALTRIRNNQVYNSDINAQYKITTKTITGGLLADNFTYTGNMTIGNLTVNGQTTTVDTTNLVIADPLLAINRNQSGSPTYDLGFVMGRGNQTNVAMIWEENAQQFQLQYTTESTAATTFGTINNSGFANLQAYGIKVNNATIGTSTVTNFVGSNVSISGGTINNTTIGATTPNSGVFTSVTTASGGQLTGYLTGAIGANSANSGAFTTITATSTLVAQGTITGGGQVIGYFNGAVGANAPNTVVATSVTTSSGGQLTGYLTGAIGANTPNTAVFTTVTASGNITAQTANVYAAYLNANTATYSSGYYWSNGIAVASTITGLYGNANVATYLPTYNGNIGNLATGNLIPLVNTSYYLGNSTLYWANAYASNFNAITQLATPKIQFTVGGSSIVEDNPLDLAITGPYQISIKPASYQYTFNNTGSLTGPGGTFVYANGAVYGNLLATGLYWSNGVSYASTVTGTYSNSNVATYLATYTGNLSAGNITVTNGGEITGYLNGPIGANGANTATFTTASITSTANSYAAGQGALQISGGFYAAGDSYIAGNLIVANLQATQQSILVVQEPLLYLESYGIGTYNYDIGFYGHFIGGNNNNYQHTGLVRNYVDNEWYLFSNAPEPSGNVVTFNSNTVYDTLKLGALLIQNTTSSGSTTSGALQVAGGAGIAGNLYAGSIQNTPIGSTTASTGAFTNLSATANITAQTSNVYAGNIIGNTATYSANYYWSNGVPFAPSITGTYGNANVAAYLPTYTGNLSAGNVSISGNLNVTGNINNVLSNVYSQGGIFYGAPTTGFNALYAGQTGYTQLAQTLVQVSGNYNGFVQVNEQNTNNGSSASTDYIATADNGNQNDTYIDMGINSSGYSQVAYGLQAANDGYLYVAGNTTTGGGNLVISTTTANDIIFSLGGIATANEFARMRANTNSFVISSTTNSTSTTTGALQVRGGIGTNGNIYAAAIQNTPIGNGTPSTGVFTSVTLANGGQFVGYFTGPIGSNVANTGVFTTANVNGTLYAATINGGTIGNVGAQFTGASVSITGNIAAGNVNLSGAVTSPILIANGGINSTSSGTGSLIVVGGAGVSGNIYSGANINAATAVIAPSMYNSNIYPASGSDLYKNTGPNGNLWINYNGYAANLIVNGNTTAGYGNLFIVNGSTGQVGIKQPIGSFIGNSSFQINATDSMLLPIGTTSQRPSNATGGMIRYNSLTNQLEFYNGTTWTGTGSTFTTVASYQFTGDGTTTTFTLGTGSTTNGTIVAINGVIQIPTVAYSVSGTSLTFTEAPLSTDIIDARVITTTATVTSISDSTGGNAVIANSAVYTIANNSVRIVANTSTYFNGGIAAAMNPISLTQNTPTTIDSFSTTLYRVAKYVIKVSDSTNSVYSGAEVIVAHNGTTATSQVYGVVNTGSNSLATFSSTVSGGTLSVTANTWSSTATATVFPTYMPI